MFFANLGNTCEGGAPVHFPGPFAVGNGESNAQGWLECVQESAQGYLPPSSGF